jgi:hypothetical protein
MIVQGEDLDFDLIGWELKRLIGLKTVTVRNKTTGAPIAPGLISGSTYGPDACPDSIVLGHWDAGVLNDEPRGTPNHGKGLHKDNAQDQGFLPPEHLP